MKIWNVLRLIFLNVLVIDSLRNLPIIASLGSNLFILYFITAIIFLLPVAYISRRIAEVGIEQGAASIYQFTAMELGKNFAVMQEIFLWAYNALWYPTLIIFLAQFVFPVLHLPTTQNHFAVWLLVPLMFLSALPVRFSSSVSSITALVGAIIPMSILAFYAFFHLNSLHYFVPKFAEIKIDYVPTVFFSLMGIELATMHSDLLFSKKSEWNLALWISIPIILFLLIGCGLALSEFGQGLFLESLSATLMRVFDFFPAYVGKTVVIFVAISVLSQAVFWMQATARGITKAFTNETGWQKVRVAVLLQTIVTLVIMLGIQSHAAFNNAFLYISNLSVLLAVFYYAILMASYAKYCHQQKRGRSWAIIGIIGLIILGAITCLTL